MLPKTPSLRRVNKTLLGNFLGVKKYIQPVCSYSILFAFERIKLLF